MVFQVKTYQSLPSLDLDHGPSCERKNNPNIVLRLVFPLSFVFFAFLSQTQIQTSLEERKILKPSSQGVLYFHGDP